MTTLIIGARGHVGRHVLDQLVAAGEPVRASVRDLAAADFPDGVQTVAADLTKPETLTAALDGVRRVFLYSTPGSAEGFVAAARAAGVEYVVLMSSGSVLLPYAKDNAITREHRDVEDVLSGSGLRWTPIRPLVLATNALNWASSIRDERVVRTVLPGSVTAPVHERDIAAVAVAALTETARGDASAMLTGPELLSQRRQIELIGAAIGATVRVEEISADEARATFGEFEGPETVDAILEFIAAAAEGGSPATTAVADILGRPPVPFEQWAQEHAREF